jgi:hypothetical protein
VEGGPTVEEPVEALPRLPLEELGRDNGVLAGVPFFSSCSFFRALRSAHHIVMD